MKIDKKIIYVVTASGGEYEDAYTRNEAGTFDHDKAVMLLAELEAKQVAYNEVVEKVAALRRVIDERLGPQLNWYDIDQLKIRDDAQTAEKLEFLISLGYDSRDLWSFQYVRDEVFTIEELEFI